MDSKKQKASIPSSTQSGDIAKAVQEMTSSGQDIGKTLFVDRSTSGINFDTLVANVVQYVNLNELVKSLDKAKEYIVQIPLKYQDKYESGEYFFNTNLKTGVMWPALMEKQADGKIRFVGNLPIKEQNMASQTFLLNVSTSFYNVAIQNQIADIAKDIKKISETVNRIEQNQLDEKVGTLKAGREKIEYALSVQDEFTRKLEISLGRSDLVTAKDQIGQMLKRRIENFEPIPDGWLMQRIKVFFDEDYLNDKDDEVQKIQYLYALYLEATKLIAASYVMTGESATAMKVFEKSIAFMQGIGFDEVKTIEYIHQNSDLKKWFFNRPVEYIQVEKSECEEDSKKYDFMLVNITGEELKEALNNGENEIPKPDVE